MGLGRPARPGSRARACTASCIGYAPWILPASPTWSMSTGQQRLSLGLSVPFWHHGSISGLGLSYINQQHEQAALVCMHAKSLLALDVQHDGHQYVILLSQSILATHTIKTRLPKLEIGLRQMTKGPVRQDSPG